VRGRLPVPRAALAAAGVVIGVLAFAPIDAAAAISSPALSMSAAVGSPQAGAPQTVTVGDVAEAWYADAPADACSAPVGCLPSPVPSSPFPPDTLHVGYGGTQETARSYVQPDFTLVPIGATLLSGTMTVPVATDTNSGTASPDTARITACLAAAPVTDGVQGSTAKPPTADCSVGTSAKYDATQGVFTIDLQPFLHAWSTGTPADGIALLPDARSQPTDVWHVAFNGRNRQGFPHISSTVTYSAPDTSTPAPLPSFTPASSAPGPAAAPPPVSLTGGSGLVSMPQAQLSQAQQLPPQVAPTSTAAPLTATQPVAYAHRVHTSLAYIAPLLLAAGALFLGRLFTRDATPVRLP
jgi:hypothetical protein